MDIQKIIQVIADVFASKKRNDAPSSILNQVLTATRETRDDGGDDVPSTTPSEGDGLIGYYSLTDWWLSTFTAEERKEIHARHPFAFTYAPLDRLGYTGFGGIHDRLHRKEDISRSLHDLDDLLHLFLDNNPAARRLRRLVSKTPLDLGWRWWAWGKCKDAHARIH